MMSQRQIFVLNPDPIESDFLAKLCRRFGMVLSAESLETAAASLRSSDVQVAVLEASLASFASTGGSFKKTTGIVITGGDEAKLHSRAGEWPADYYVDTCNVSLPVFDEHQFYRVIERALAHTQLKSELRDARNALELNEARVKEVYSEIKEIKGLVNDNFIKELEKRIAIEAKYVWFQKERLRIEKVLRKIYAANDASSLLDIITDIKDIVQAGGATIYVLDASETLGKYLKPLVWDDAFLTHPEFSKFIAPLDAQDFAASVARLGREINITELSFDKRLSRRYLEHLKTPLKSLMGVPIMHDEEVIGVVEVYNKASAGKSIRAGFTREDQEILRGLSEHIAISMTKLNLIQYDALTGLLRPDPFFEKVIQKINSQSKRRREEGACALVMGDVDWFKNYNDRNGHEAGNKLLRELAGVLKFSIREEDLLCRYGGEEFLFFLTGVKSLEDACLLTDRIRKNVEEHYFELQEFQPRNNLTMSFGVALLPKKRLDASSPIGRSDLKLLAGEADMAMAEAKGKKVSEPGPGELGERALMKNKVCSYSREWVEEKGGGTIQTYKETSYKEKRRYERFNASTVLMIKEDGGFKVTKTVNLSLGGAKILTEARLPLAKTFDLVLVLGNKATPLRSDVIYSDKAAGESPYFYSGLRFKALTPAEHKDLEAFFLTSCSRGTEN
jgi:diguanylate cyclase (GGDEF)-like protein